MKNLTTMSYDDPVHSPSHYTSGKYETIDYIEDKLTADLLNMDVGRLDIKVTRV